MANTHPDTLGPALAKLRRARGWTQDEVARRIPTYYGDGGAYGRIEREERHPDRDALLAILLNGLLLTDATDINRVLQLAGYNVLTADEKQKLGPSRAPDEPVFQTASSRNPILTWPSAATLMAALVAAGLLSWLVREHALFAFLSSCHYAALYVVSLYLESAFNPERILTTRTALHLFAFMAISSIAALAIDRALVDSGNEFALLFSLAILIAAAVSQFAIARRVLPPAALVPATFQTQTAQSAHLKNTGNFLLIVLFFWLPPFHCVVSLTREARLGQGDWVRQVSGHNLMVGRGVLALSVPCLLGLLLVMFLIALYMGAHLLESLRPQVQLNSFALLFYLRALLYFLLCLLCIGWYAYSLSELTSLTSILPQVGS